MFEKLYNFHIDKFTNSHTQKQNFIFQGQTSKIIFHGFLSTYHITEKVNTAKISHNRLHFFKQ